MGRLARVVLVRRLGFRVEKVGCLWKGREEGKTGVQE
jgi:hypothetical protein